MTESEEESPTFPIATICVAPSFHPIATVRAAMRKDLVACFLKTWGMVAHSPWVTTCHTFAKAQELRARGTARSFTCFCLHHNHFRSLPDLLDDSCCAAAVRHVRQIVYQVVKTDGPTTDDDRDVVVLLLPS